MGTYKSIDEIARDYSEGVYRSKLSYPTGKFKEDHIFNENMSVKWNKEEVVQQNEDLARRRQEYRDDQGRLDNKVREDTIYTLIHDYKINEKQAELIYDTAYVDKHSSMTDVFYYAEELAEFYEKMIKLGDYSWWTS